MTNRFNFIAEAEDQGIRIDKWLVSQDEIDLSRSAVVKLIESGSVTVSGKKVQKSRILTAGDEISVEIPEPEELKIEPQDIPIEVVYEDDDLAIVNKPQGMVVHPAPGNPDGTLVNALLWRFKGQLSGINGVIRPGIVHRIDKNTAGLLVIAKNDFAHRSLAALIKDHNFIREYEAICVGHFKDKEGTVDAPIGRDPKNRKKMCVTPTNSRNAITHYRVLEELKNSSYVRFTLETGRTHQIRVHSAYLGHPILGDDVYGKPHKGCKGQCLYAKRLGFVHPRTSEKLDFSIDPPEFFEKILISER